MSNRHFPQNEWPQVEDTFNFFGSPKQMEHMESSASCSLRNLASSVSSKSLGASEFRKQFEIVGQARTIRATRPKTGMMSAINTSLPIASIKYYYMFISTNDLELKSVSGYISSKNHIVVRVHDSMEKPRLMLKIVKEDDKQYIDIIKKTFQHRIRVIKTAAGASLATRDEHLISCQIKESQQQFSTKGSQQIFYLTRRYFQGKSLGNYLLQMQDDDMHMLSEKYLPRHFNSLFKICSTAYNKLIVSYENVFMVDAGMNMQVNYTSLVGLRSLLFNLRILSRELLEIIPFLDPNLMDRAPQDRFNTYFQIYNFGVLVLSLILQRQIYLFQDECLEEVVDRIEVQKCIRANRMKDIFNQPSIQKIIKAVLDQLKENGQSYLQLLNFLFNQNVGLKIKNITYTKTTITWQAVKELLGIHVKPSIYSQELNLHTSLSDKSITQEEKTLAFIQYFNALKGINLESAQFNSPFVEELPTKRRNLWEVQQDIKKLSLRISTSWGNEYEKNNMLIHEIITSSREWANLQGIRRLRIKNETEKSQDPSWIEEDNTPYN